MVLLQIPKLSFYYAILSQEKSLTGVSGVHVRTRDTPVSDTNVESTTRGKSRNFSGLEWLFAGM